MGQPLLPDVPNWSWHEYGMRAGFWRQFKALTDRNMPVTLALNANVCSSYPRVASAALEAGFEFMGHGFVQGPMHKLDNQADAIKRAVDTIAKFTGKPPRSWESPGLTETEETLDLLRLNGIEYVADWVIDDLPQDIATPHGTITTIPYSVETNDIVIHALQHLLFRAIPASAAPISSTGCISRARPTRGSWRSRFIPTSPASRIASNIWKRLLDYVIGHDGVALMTASEIGDWYRAEMSKISNPRSPGRTRMIKAAVIGLGWWGQTILKTLRNSDVIAPVLGVDPLELARAAASALGVETAPRFEDALAQPECRGRHPLHAAGASCRTDRRGRAGRTPCVLREAAVHDRGRRGSRDRGRQARPASSWASATSAGSSPP